MLKRLCLALVSGILAVAAVAPGAAADPRGTVFSDVCDNGQTVELIFNGNGDFTPGHVVGGTAVYVVQSLDATQEFTPPGGPTTTNHFLTSKPKIHGDLVTCTFDITRTGPAGTFHGFGTIVVFLAPAK